jgi:hypothetical protein
MGGTKKNKNNPNFGLDVSASGLINGQKYIASLGKRPKNQIALD